MQHLLHKTPDIVNHESQDPQFGIKFIDSTPSSHKAKRETRALIRAHASKFSWARLKTQKTRSDTDSRVLSRQRGRPPEVGSVRIRQKSRQNSTVLEPACNPELLEDESSEPLLRSNTAASNDYFPLTADVGAGHLDPFESYPSSLPRAAITPLFDQVVHFLDHIFLPEPRETEKTVGRHWIARSLRDKVIFHALLFSQTVRNQALTQSLQTPKDPLSSICYSEVVRGVNRSFEDEVTRCDDENILAVLTLAFHGQKLPSRSSRIPSQGPMNALQGLDIYTGYIDAVHMHVAGLQKMLAIRGGLGDIQFPGLAAMISYADVMFSTRHLRKPTFPFVCNGEDLDEISKTSIPRSTHPLCALGTGFGIIDRVVPPSEAGDLRKIFADLSRYTLAIDDFVMGRPEALSLRNLANERNSTQHNLMSKCPGINNFDDQSSEAFYSSCWLAAAIYSLISVFPMAQWNAPFAILSQRLKVHMSSTTVQERWNEVPLLMLWITIMGAIGASDLPERAWYISVLERLVHRLNIKSWEDVKVELEKLLWYDSVSSPDGYMIWKEIKNSSPFSA